MFYVTKDPDCFGYDEFIAGIPRVDTLEKLSAVFKLPAIILAVYLGCLLLGNFSNVRRQQRIWRTPRTKAFRQWHMKYDFTEALGGMIQEEEIFQRTYEDDTDHKSLTKILAKYKKLMYIEKNRMWIDAKRRKNILKEFESVPKPHPRGIYSKKDTGEVLWSHADEIVEFLKELKSWPWQHARPPYALPDLYQLYK